MNESNSQPLLVLRILLFALFVAVLLFGMAYIDIMFKGDITAESLTEAANYAAQTVTTVGYGNWVPKGVDAQDPRILEMKLISVPFMLLGATLFAVIIGIVANLISRL